MRSIPLSRLSMVTLFLMSLSPVLIHAQSSARQVITQKVGDVWYFCIAFDQPKDLHVASFSSLKKNESHEAQKILLARQPRLVPQNTRTRLVYPLAETVLSSEGKPMLCFIGVIDSPEKTTFRLIYPTRPTIQNNNKNQVEDVLRTVKGYADAWKESVASVNLSKPERFAKEKDVSIRLQHLDKRWAEAQAQHFAILEALTPDYGFFRFARQTTGRQHNVASSPILSRKENQSIDLLQQRLYEMTTASTALTESLALQRMLELEKKKEPRTIPVQKIQGINIAEHPWKKMMGDKKPAIERMALVVPHDQYYVTFHSMAALIRFGDLLDQWGGNLMNALELHGHDYEIRKRYEKQLCLDSQALMNLPDQKIIRNVTITGSDPYFREGTDVTVLFEMSVNSLDTFAGMTRPFLEKAKKEFGERILINTTVYRGVRIISHVTPHREISLYRAILDRPVREHHPVVAHSNSLVALQRIIDVHQGRRKSLADSLDFQYMRTTFVKPSGLDMQHVEAGFAFLSDAFIRRLVGPESRIREKRRLEAMASLSLVTNAALFHVHQNGILPKNFQALKEFAQLRDHEIEIRDGKGISWDAHKQLASSDVYGTLTNATPLIEIPIDKVTRTESQQYERFRQNYLRLWRRYFDPIGIRFSWVRDEIKLETYVLPLINNSRYNELSGMSGGKPIDAIPAKLPPQTVFHSLFQVRLDGFFPIKWYSIHLEDTPILSEAAGWWIKQQLGMKVPQRALKDWLWRTPFVFGVGTTDRARGADLFRFAVMCAGMEVTKTVEKKHRDITITEHHLRQKGEAWLPELRELIPDAGAKIYTTSVEDGYYVSFLEQPLKNLVDQAYARHERIIKGEKEEKIPVHVGLHLSPRHKQIQQGLQFYLEWEVHRRAIHNGPLIENLYRCGLLTERSDHKHFRKVTKHYLGFVPVSPDGAKYTYDSHSGEVVSARHGSLRRPKLEKMLEKDSSVNGLLQKIHHLRADLRFKEDGVIAVLRMNLGN